MTASAIAWPVVDSVSTSHSPATAPIAFDPVSPSIPTSRRSSGSSTRIGPTKTPTVQSACTLSAPMLRAVPRITSALAERPGRRSSRLNRFVATTRTPAASRYSPPLRPCPESAKRASPRDRNPRRKRDGRGAVVGPRHPLRGHRSDQGGTDHGRNQQGDDDRERLHLTNLARGTDAGRAAAAPLRLRQRTVRALLESEVAAGAREREHERELAARSVDVVDAREPLVRVERDLRGVGVDLLDAHHRMPGRAYPFDHALFDRLVPG